jgi:glycerol-3-phosphate dehydrogenase
MSEDAVDSAVSDLMRIVPDSCTEGLAIIGADGYSVLLNKADDLASDYGVSSSTILHLLERYGSLFHEVLEPAILDKNWSKPIVESLPYLRAEILYAVTHEGARSIDDVLSRRTRISFEASDQGTSAVEEVGEIISKVLGWNKTQTQASIDEYLAIVEEQRSALERTLRETV